MLVTLVQYGLPIVVSTLLLTIYLAIFKILLSYWMIIVVLIYLLLMLCVHTVTSFFHLMHCKKEQANKDVIMVLDIHTKKGV